MIDTEREFNNVRVDMLANCCEMPVYLPRFASHVCARFYQGVFHSSEVFAPTADISQQFLAEYEAALRHALHG